MFGLTQICDVLSPGATEDSRRFAGLGAIFLIRRSMPSVYVQNFENILNLIWDAVTNECFELLFDCNAMPVGYILWGFVESISSEERGKILIGRSDNVCELGKYILSFCCARPFMAKAIRHLAIESELSSTFIKYENKREGARFKIKRGKFFQNLKRARQMEDHFSDNLDTTRFDLTLPSHRLAKFLRVHPHKNFLPLSVSRFNSGLLLGQALYLAKLEYNIISRSPEFINLLCNAIDLEFLSVSLDDSGRPVAVLVWAWLSRETISRITDDPTTPIHRFEMNDGNILSILYYAGSPEPLAELVFSWIEDVGKQENNILLHPFLLNVSSDIAANLTKVISVMTK